MKRKVSLIFVLMLSLVAWGTAAFADDYRNVLSEAMIPFRFASKEEGTELMFANEAYYAKFIPNKLGL